MNSPSDLPVLPDDPTIAPGLPRVHVETFGCQMNFMDTEIVKGRFLDRRFQLSADRHSADVICLNTCSVRDHAEERVRQRLWEMRTLKQRNPRLVVAVLGCMAQREGEDLLERFPQVDVVCGTREFGRIAEFVERVRDGFGPVLALGEDDPMPDRDHIELRPYRHSAYVTVQRGCDRACTFCVVPRTRGPEVERSMDDLESEVRTLVADGVVDVTLLGQIVNAYGRKQGGDASLARLLRRLDRVKGLRRLRFITSFPTLMTADLLDAMRDCASVAAYLHLPVQSGSSSCLKRMARGYTSDTYRRLAERIREHVPGVEIATDIITGFCGETEEEHQDTLQLMADLQFIQVFIFKYSVRPGTAAERVLADDVPESLKSRRNQELLALQESIQARRNRAMEGRNVEVLVDGPSKRNPRLLAARTSSNQMVHFDGPLDLVGRLVEVCIVRSTALSMRATLPAP